MLATIALLMLATAQQSELKVRNARVSAFPNRRLP